METTTQPDPSKSMDFVAGHDSSENTREGAAPAITPIQPSLCKACRHLLHHPPSKAHTISSTTSLQSPISSTTSSRKPHTISSTTPCTKLVDVVSSTLGTKLVDIVSSIDACDREKDIELCGCER
uniref:Uncharacterized protein n=1 Tax=Cannabis sativa TaxID=3483 RepID=A0A803PDN2_CANSA